MKHRAALLGVLAATLAACTNVASLQYVPTASFTPSAASGTVHDVVVVDQRGESDPTWYGAIRGGFGNPVKTLHTEKPVGEVVGDAFRSALQSRGLPVTGDGSRRVNVTITRFECDQFARREANVGLTVDVQDSASGRSLYRHKVEKTVVSGSALALDTGVFSAPSDLQAVAQTAMSQAIDAALSDPGFQAAIGRRA